MATCPFMSKGNGIGEMSSCVISCALRVKNTCAFNILAQKALYDAKRESDLDTKDNGTKTTDSTGNM